MANEKRLIEMEDALRRMENAEHLMHSINGIKAVDIGALRQFFGMLKPVDAVEVVHGRWVRKAHDGAFGVFHLWHCSVCDTIRARQDPYCGECGAKMDGGANNG